MTTTESVMARAEVMLSRLAQAQSQAASHQTRTEIEVARARANKASAALRAAKDAVPSLEEHSVTVDVRVSGTLLKDTARARAALRNAASSMVGMQPEEVASRAGAPSVDTSLDTAAKLANTVLIGLNRSVDQWRQKILPARIGEPIVIFPGASDALAIKLRNIQFRLQRKVEAPTAEQLTQLARQIKDDAITWNSERPKLDTSLESSHPEIREFLRRAITEEGASWQLITPIVATWLENPENTANLSVVLRT